jgi:serine/threonine protein kinase
LGIVVYVLLMGYLPSNILRVQPEMAVINRQPGVELISQEAKEFVLELLERDPSKRLSGTQVLSHRWFRHNPFGGVSSSVLRSMSDALKPVNVAVDV